MKTDPSLLDLMMSDHQKADPLWQATAYWQDIAIPLADYFSKEHNAVNFRRAPIRTGIRSVMPDNPGRFPHLSKRGERAVYILRKLPLFGRLFENYEALQRQLVDEHTSTFRHSLILSYLLLKEKHEEKNVLEDSLVGNPDDYIQIQNRFYSYRSLGYQFLYGQLSRYLDFSEINSVIELGSGYGGQAEIILRKNPHIKYIAVDIPPWLYIAELYLETLFPGQVLSYRITRDIENQTSIFDLMKGKRVAIVPSWKWTHLTDTFDLFWNAKSLQEMNENAENYLQRAMSYCRFLFLHAYSSIKKTVYQPDQLRQMVVNPGLFRQIFYDEDLYAGKNSYSMFFERNDTRI